MTLLMVKISYSANIGFLFYMSQHQDACFDHIHRAYDSQYRKQGTSTATPADYRSEN